MRGWLAGLGLIGLLNLIAVGHWHYDDGLHDSFENLDTRVILRRLQQPHAVGEWFVGDWVLGNGFYRPLPSVLYQVDYWLWGANLLAWKWTNGLLATLNALLVVGVGWALSGRRALALLAGCVFTYWQTGLLPDPPLWLGWVGLGAGVLWGWRVGDWRRGALWGCLAYTLVVELRFILTLPDIHQQTFAYRAMGWIPARTATLMTLFALLAIVGTCVYARTGRLRWAALGLLGFLGALLSYEQAVVLPLMMGLCSVSVSRGAIPRALLLPSLCLCLLIPYFAFYRTHIPTHTEYHQQRLKRFTTLPETTLYWLVPTGREALMQWDVARIAPFNWVMPAFWLAQLGLVAYLVALRAGLRTRLGLVGWLGSLLAYAPLMPVLPLMHYYYFPAVFRALWAGILLLCLLTLRPTRRATSVALVDAMCPRRSSPRSTS
ncbi:MAG: hypothetical protein CFK49_08520 [Armatimonadetes bacterium JP3_11]|nr:MAG: hypothetical protein CFK48_02650 [Armatimonadetes bacterium CP1_7O]OYT74412.1 MAG: hypothetical protein CFK49_08520 [Armatimonadetes bacterium JP3_11]RMH09348.1 MAG: hypothetical protein D6697_03875 [Armatimonadota bacterium]